MATGNLANRRRQETLNALQAGQRIAGLAKVFVIASVTCLAPTPRAGNAAGVDDLIAQGMFAIVR